MASFGKSARLVFPEQPKFGNFGCEQFHSHRSRLPFTLICYKRIWDCSEIAENATSNPREYMRWNTNPWFVVLLFCFTCSIFQQSYFRIREDICTVLQQNSLRSVDDRELILPPRRESTGNVGDSSVALKMVAINARLELQKAKNWPVRRWDGNAYSRAEFSRRHQRSLATLAALGKLTSCRMRD
jgi:hypothetical protein